MNSPFLFLRYDNSKSWFMVTQLKITNEEKEMAEAQIRDRLFPLTPINKTQDG